MRIKDRRAGLGASELPVIAGISPYQTPVELWLRKTGSPEQVDSIAMAIGRQLEVPVLRLVAKQEDIAFRHNRVTWTHHRWPEVPLYATPDAIGPGVGCLGEIKVVGDWMANDWAGGVPDYIRLQAFGQLAVHPKAEFVLVAGLLGGTRLQVERIYRDELVIAELEERAAEWWRDHVVAGVPPEPSSEEDRWALLRRMVVIDRREERPATPEEEARVEAYGTLDRSIKRLKGDADVLRRETAEASREADIRGSGWTARWYDRQGTPSFRLLLGSKREEIEA